MRQWVLSVPKRLRFFLEREPKAVSAVLHIFLRVVEAHLRQRIPDATAGARLGAVSFVQRFGSALNRHVHYDENHPGSRASRALPGAQIRSRRIGHCCILHGLFEPLEDGRVRFLHAPALTPEDIVVIGEEVRRRVLRWFARTGRLDAEDARDRLGWDNGGFSLDAAVRIGGRDRAGLERRLRYGARPPFALERLEPVNAHRVVYHLPKPRRDGRTALSLTPLELIDHLAALIPPPRLHRHRYHGALAPNSPLRAAATAYGREAGDVCEPAAERSSSPAASESAFRSPARDLWAMRLARLFESLPLACPHCGADRHASLPSLPKRPLCSGF
jgi:hypothetical protein